MKQRTILELLHFLLEKQKHFYIAATGNGLCLWAAYLLRENYITDDEHLILKSYIRLNRPHSLSSISAYRHKKDIYYWEPGKISYRIAWIKKHIKKQEKLLNK